MTYRDSIREQVEVEDEAPMTANVKAWRQSFAAQILDAHLARKPVRYTHKGSPLRDGFVDLSMLLFGERNKELKIGYHGIMTEYAQQTDRGATTEEMQEAINAVVGAYFASRVKPRAAGKYKTAYRGVLFLECSHSVYRFELQSKLPALRAALAKFGFKDVRLG